MRSGFVAVLMLACTLQSVADGDWVPKGRPGDLPALKAAYTGAIAKLDAGASAATPEGERDLLLRRIRTTETYRSMLVSLRRYAVSADDDAEELEATVEIQRLDAWLAVARRRYGGASGTATGAGDPLIGGLEDGLVLRYTFDGESGQGVADASSHGRHGENHGAAWVKQGRKGGGCWFDGVDDYISVPVSNAVWRTGRFTVSLCVFRHAAEEADERLVTKGTLATRDFWVHVTADNRADGGVRHPPSGDETRLTLSRVHSEGVVRPSGWVHVAVTYDGRAMALYINGKRDRTAAAPGGLALSDGPLEIGRSGPHKWHYGFMGVLDDVMLWNRALTEVEVLGLHAWLFPPEIHGNSTRRR